MKDTQKPDAQKKLKTPTKLCLRCNKKLTDGRTDKKFCDDGCRSIYNYEHKDPIRSNIVKINQILKKNRDTLHTLNTDPDNKTTIFKSQLDDQEFNFNYFTNIYETEKGDRYFYCYDMGYLLLGKKTVLIVVKDNYPKIINKKYASQNFQPAYLNDSE